MPRPVRLFPYSKWGKTHNTTKPIDKKRKKYYHYSIDLEKQTDPVRQEMETRSMKPRREDTLFVYKTHLFVNNNDCLHGKSNRNFRQILEFFFNFNKFTGKKVNWKNL